MNDPTRYFRIKHALKQLDDADLLTVHNDYCIATNCVDDMVYDMVDFDDILNGLTPEEIARKVYYGHDFNPNRCWFRFNGYANLESFDYLDDPNSGIYPTDIADYIDRTGNALNCPEIEAVLADED